MNPAILAANPITEEIKNLIASRPQAENKEEIDTTILSYLERVIENDGKDETQHIFFGHFYGYRQVPLKVSSAIQQGGQVIINYVPAHQMPGRNVLIAAIENRCSFAVITKMAEYISRFYEIKDLNFIFVVTINRILGSDLEKNIQKETIKILLSYPLDLDLTDIQDPCYTENRGLLSPLKLIAEDKYAEFRPLFKASQSIRLALAAQAQDAPRITVMKYLTKACELEIDMVFSTLHCEIQQANISANEEMQKKESYSYLLKFLRHFHLLYCEDETNKVIHRRFQSEILLLLLVQKCGQPNSLFATSEQRREFFTQEFSLPSLIKGAEFEERFLIMNQPPAEEAKSDQASGSSSQVEKLLPFLKAPIAEEPGEEPAPQPVDQQSADSPQSFRN